MSAFHRLSQEEITQWVNRPFPADLGKALEAAYIRIDRLEALLEVETRMVKNLKIILSHYTDMNEPLIGCLTCKEAHVKDLHT